MHKRTHLIVARAIAILAAALVIAAVLLMVTGCQSPTSSLRDEIASLKAQLAEQSPASPLEPGGIADSAKKALSALKPDPGTAAPAERSLWPFTWVGFATLAWGVVHMIMFRNPIALIIGAALAAFPFVVLYTSKSFLIPTSIGVGIITLIWMGLTVGTKLGIFKTRTLAVQRSQYLTNMIAQKKVPESEVYLTGEVARALSWVGKPTFNPEAPDLPHHDSDPILVKVQDPNPIAEHLDTLEIPR